MGSQVVIGGEGAAHRAARLLIVEATRMATQNGAELRKDADLDVVSLAVQQVVLPMRCEMNFGPEVVIAGMARALGSFLAQAGLPDDAVADVLPMFEREARKVHAASREALATLAPNAGRA